MLALWPPGVRWRWRRADWRRDAGTATPEAEGSEMGETATQSGYAPVNGLQMYYEIHGAGEPLVLLHGAFGDDRPVGTDPGRRLAEDHQVIAVELQGHGHTADIDRPFSYERLRRRRGGPDGPPRRRAGRHRRLQHGWHDRVAVRHAAPGPGAQAGGHLGRATVRTATTRKSWPAFRRSRRKSSPERRSRKRIYATRRILRTFQRSSTR